MTPICSDNVCVGVESLSRGLSWNHTCLVATDHSVWCWGENNDGQIGLESISQAERLPRRVHGLSEVVEITTGGNFSCAVKTGGTVVCWGSNLDGTLGSGAFVARRALPGVELSVAGDGGMVQLTGVSHVAASLFHLCALVSNGSVYCWGRNNFGQLGVGDQLERRVPTLVMAAPGIPLEGVTHLATNTLCTCALLATGRVRCWGHAASCGLNRTDDADIPYADATTELTLAGVSRLEGGDYHACAVVNPAADGGLSSAVCWGLNGDGQLGLGLLMPFTQAAPAPVPGLSDVVSIPCGHRQTCALSGGRVTCFGENFAGQLGDGTISDDSGGLHAEVLGISDAVELQVRSRSACVRHQAGGVSCWGVNTHGQLGRGSISNAQPTPAPVALY